MAEARAGRVDEPRIARLQHIPAVAEALHGAGPEVLHQHVRAFQQALEMGTVVGLLQVQRDTFLAAVDRHEIGRLAADERAEGTGIVPRAGHLHLDDPGAEVRQHHGAVGPRQNAGEVDDRDPVEGPRNAQSEALRPQAPAKTISPWGSLVRGASSMRRSLSGRLSGAPA